MLPEIEPCEPLARPAGRPVAPRSRPVHVRRLALVTGLFVVGVVGILWVLGVVILHDLSQRFITDTITQAQQEAESFAQAASDERFLGEGDRLPAVRGTRDGPIDPELLLEPLMPEVLDPDGRPIDTGPGGLRGPENGEVVTRPPPPRDGTVRGVMITSGQEWQYRLNGELIGRDVVHSIDIRSKSGFQRIDFRKIEGRYVARDALEAPGAVFEQVPIHRAPSSRPVLVTWPARLNGEPVQLQAALDGDYLDRGVRELRRRVVPKLVGGGVALLVLVGLVSVYVAHLVGAARRLEAEVAEQDMLAQVGMLAAGLAHEIRNPLNAVNINLQLLEEDLGAPPAAVPAGGTAPLLRSTRREIGRLSALVTDFLAYARPAVPRRAPTVVDALVKECVDLFRPVAEGEGVGLELRLESGTDAVLVDEGMIRQAVMNVVLNAIQAAPSPGGRVTVATRRVGRSVQVEVTDDGPGLPADAEQVFQAFRSTKKGGTGLGLSISRALVERHCGTLLARNAPGGGARFTISIPAEAA